VCAFANTPKYDEAKRDGGKVVSKEWIEHAKRDRKRYPWR